MEGSSEVNGRFQWGRFEGESLNDSDELVGNAYATDSTGIAFYWTPRKFNLATLQTLGGNGSYAYAINNRGAIAGSSARASDGDFHAVLWPDYTSAPADLGTLPGGIESDACGINSAGQVVGGADVP